MIVQRGAFIESQYQQSPARLSRFCFINSLRCNDEVDPPIEQSLGAFPWGIYDRLLVHVKAGVNEDRDTGYFLERRKDIEIQRIGFTHDGLRPSRPVDMHDRCNAITPVWPHVASNGHKPASIGIDLIYIEHLARSVRRYHWSERHKFSAIEARIEQIMCLATRRISQD